MIFNFISNTLPKLRRHNLIKILCPNISKKNILEIEYINVKRLDREMKSGGDIDK